MVVVVAVVVVVVVVVVSGGSSSRCFSAWGFRVWSRAYACKARAHHGE